MNKVKARIVCFGIDDELRNDTSSIFSTTINSTLYPVPTPIAPNLAPALFGTRTGIEPVNFTQRLNTKRYKFSLNPNLKNLGLSKNAKMVIESITIPNVINDYFLQSKCVNNVILKLKGISNHNIWDSSTQGKGSSIIFTCPILLNTQGFGRTLDGANPTAYPDFILASQKARINCDNNGYLFMNTNPNLLYNFSISEDFLKNGILEFELIYDLGNITSLTTIIGAPVSSLILGNGGNNYTNPTTVSFSSPYGATGATASVDIGFPVSSVIINNNGAGYATDPAITFDAPTIAGGTTATGTAVRGFPVASTTLVSGGTGYSSAPSVSFTPPPPVITATVTAFLTGNSITSLNLTNEGLGYIAQPTITITGGGGTGAVITAIYSGSTTKITGFTINNGGTGYTSAPLITIVGGGGITATGTANLTTGAVSSITITNGGTNYTTAPTISFSGGGGTGANFNATLGTTGILKTITLTNAGGIGYTSVPNITIGGAGGAVATAVLSTTLGTIRRINLLTGGYGYTSAPTITFNNATGTGATATSTLSAPTEAHYTQYPQTLDINTDKNDLESFMISMVITDEEDDDKIYNDKKLLNKINRLLLDKLDK